MSCFYGWPQPQPLQARAHSAYKAKAPLSFGRSQKERLLLALPTSSGERDSRQPR